MLKLPKLTRDTGVFLLGVFLLVNEAVLRHGAERPTLIYAGCALLGLPVLFRADESRRGEDKDKK